MMFFRTNIVSQNIMILNICLNISRKMLYQTFPSFCFLQDSATAADDTQSRDQAACRHTEVTESNNRQRKNRKQKDKVGP